MPPPQRRTSRLPSSSIPLATPSPSAQEMSRPRRASRALPGVEQLLSSARAPSGPAARAAASSASVPSDPARAWPRSPAAPRASLQAAPACSGRFRSRPTTRSGIGIRARLDEDPADLALVDPDVVGPLDLRSHVGQRLAGLGDSERRRERRVAMVLLGRPQNHAHQQRAAGRRNPAPSLTTATGGLLVGGERRAVRCAGDRPFPSRSALVESTTSRWMCGCRALRSRPQNPDDLAGLQPQRRPRHRRR